MGKIFWADFGLWDPRKVPTSDELWKLGPPHFRTFPMWCSIWCQIPEILCRKSIKGWLEIEALPLDLDILSYYVRLVSPLFSVTCRKRCPKHLAEVTSVCPRTWKKSDKRRSPFSLYCFLWFLWCTICFVSLVCHHCCCYLSGKTVT